jgi:succinate dehydrogenase/fumarate reductase flavoprotein subunit
MQHHCGATKSDDLLSSGLKVLQDVKEQQARRVFARNPHELVRSLEVLNVLTNAELVIHACLVRKASARHLHFVRSDYPEQDPPAWHKFVTVRLEDDEVVGGSLPIDYFQPLKEDYEGHNRDYVGITAR